MKIGIDPGKVNTGVVLLDENDDILESCVLSMKDIGLVGVVDKIWELCNPHDITSITSVGIERYVAYRGVMTADSEYIIKLIGALEYLFESNGFPVKLYRAVDWKIRLCKHLFKTCDFKNPSKKFDKKYSMAAAEAVIGYSTKTDHEADAACIAYYAGVDK